MAKLTLGTETLDVAALSLETLEKAAPFIDAVNDNIGGAATWPAISANFRNILSIAATSLYGNQPGFDVAKAAGEFMAKASLKDSGAIWKFFNEIMVESGLIAADKPSGEDQAGVSTTPSPQPDETSGQGDLFATK